MRVEAGAQRGRGREVRSGFVDHDDIQASQFVLMLPKRFTNDTFDTVSSGCELAVLLADGESEPGCLFRARTTQYGEQFITAACRFRKNAAEVGRVQEPVVFGKAQPDVRVSAIYCGVRRARPLARRRFSTRRPALVAIRARKPWVRARFSLLG
jgi:hypothetical protein